MKLTTFYKLRKPEGKDVVDVDDFNYNFDEIDTALNDAANASGDLSNGKVFTSMATSRVAPASGDTLAVIVSKIMKWLNDLGAAAFRSVANNSTTTADGYVADARALTAVAQRVASLESSFPDGCRIIARAITAGRGTYASPITGVSTADNASPTTMATNIKTLATNNYNAAKVGTAQAGDVLAGKTFTNSNTVGGNGSLADYRNNIQTVATTATGGTPTGTRPDSVTAWTEDLNVAAGVHNKVRVNKLASYKQGVTDADNRANPDSANYKAGVASVKTDKTLTVPTTRGTSVDITDNWYTKVDNTACYDAGVTSVKQAHKLTLTASQTGTDIDIADNWYTTCDASAVYNAGYDAARTGFAFGAGQGGSGTETKLLAKGRYQVRGMMRGNGGNQSYITITNSHGDVLYERKTSTSSTGNHESFNGYFDIGSNAWVTFNWFAINSDSGFIAGGAYRE